MGIGDALSFREVVESAGERASCCLDEICSHPNDYEKVHEALRGFIQNKYLLDDEEMTTDNILALSEISLKKMLSRYRKETLQDVSSVCSGASSASTKKVLLIMALQKELGIKFDLETYGSIDSVAALSKAVVTKMN